MKYKLYQQSVSDNYVSNESINHISNKTSLSYRFYDKEKGLQLTYEGDIEEYNSIEELLEKIYNLFNSDERPNRNYSTSLMKGDVVYCDNKYYICELVGFKSIEMKKNN